MIEFLKLHKPTENGRTLYLFCDSTLTDVSTHPSFLHDVRYPLYTTQPLTDTALPDSQPSLKPHQASLPTPSIPFSPSLGERITDT